MKQYRHRLVAHRPQRRLLVCALASCLAMAAGSVHAQSTAATLRGNVTGSSVAGAEVTVTNPATGFSRKTTARADGSYILPGLPPGSYRVDVTAGGATSTQTVTLMVSQTATLNLPVGSEVAPSGDASTLEAIEVRSAPIAEVRTSEIATYITQRQIDAIPQNSRNFLAFADSVPGVQFEQRSNGTTQLRGGGQSSNGVNVYIDGVGQKNYVLKGGISGQDQSQGNPFPQGAIAEYKVITQNYKAEFDQLSSVAVTALTKSGTNEFHGDVFMDYTDEDWRARRPSEDGRDKVPSQYKQYGTSFGGPIVKDLLHFFVSYEAKDVMRPADVKAGANVDATTLPADVQSRLGPTSNPFSEDLYFAKLTFTPGDAHLFELTGKYRNEEDIDGVGGINTSDVANAKFNKEKRADLRYQYTFGDWLNDAHITYESSFFQPSSINNVGYGIHLETRNNNNPRDAVLYYGAGENFQRKGQKGVSFQDDLTWTGWQFAGEHTVKMGVKYKEIDITAFEQSPRNPQFYYDINESYSVPNRVQFGQLVPGVGPLNIKTSNKQLGLYIQDDWAVNDKLTLNLGIRWDYEKTPSYLDYQPRPELVTALHNWANIQHTDYNIDDYIGNGHNRKAFKDAFQPRLGFSYDLFEDQRHVIFGGAGRSYDRNLFDYLALERSKGVFPRYEFLFDTPDHPCAVGTGNCVAWNPAYLDPANLAPLVAANPNLGGEINLINNNLKTPYSDQFSLGMRNTFTMAGIDWNTSATISRIESRDGIVFSLGNRYPDGSFRNNPNFTWGSQPWGFGIPGFGTLILANNGIETRTNQLLLSLEKPYSIDSGWGMTLAYTYSDAKENRMNAAISDEHYTFDYPNVDGQGFLRSIGVAKHRLVLTGTIDGPWGMVYSGKAIYASPTPKEATNCHDTTSFDNCFFDPLIPDGTFGQRQIDLAVQKNIDLGAGLGLRFRFDIQNIFNYRNWTDYDTWRGGPTDTNANFGHVNGPGFLEPVRTFKLSMGATF